MLFLIYEFYLMCYNNDECMYDIKIKKKIVLKFVGFFVNFFGFKLSFNKVVFMVVSWLEGFFVCVVIRYVFFFIVFWCMIIKLLVGLLLRYIIFCVLSMIVGVKNMDNKV